MFSAYITFDVSILVACVLAANDDLVFSHFDKVPEFDNLGSSAEHLSLKARNIPLCCSKCAQSENCSGIVFNKHTSVCSFATTCLYGETLNVPQAGSRYYRFKGQTKPSKCSEVKSCCRGDGEYWIYPPVFQGERTRIYCHNMSSEVPTEYVTLPAPNVGFYPNANDANCDGNIIPLNAPRYGLTTFRRIRVDIQTMTVDVRDKRFATSSSRVNNYGRAIDCYTRHVGNVRNSCGPKGTFHIDTTGTGLVFNRTLEWHLTTLKSWGTLNKSADGTVIDILGGGFCGGFRPYEPMALEINPLEVVGDTTDDVCA
ncbi:A disintegrin and metalloproteinase with thrombospondin motifs 9-like [Haliotis cracherodii]|uniref:A disintegrin and metalloproteinase with thrombospondin motifs 9-like n=1 Tax=Haliotis cracherodii TaxID=6455 RepID=UPI0039E7B4B3